MPDDDTDLSGRKHQGVRVVFRFRQFPGKSGVLLYFAAEAADC